MSLNREPHRVAVVVFCEAEGVDARDASRVAEIALNRLIHENKQDTGASLLGSTVPPTCASCGSRPDLNDDGTIGDHAKGDHWLADGFEDHKCEGSGKPPRVPDEPVIGFERPDGLGIYTRVHEVLDLGMALGNGYAWTSPTSKAYR